MSKRFLLLFTGLIIIFLGVLVFDIKSFDGENLIIEQHIDVEDVVSEAEETIEELQEQQIQEYLNKMSLEEKVAQLFVVLPEALLQDKNTVIFADLEMQKAIEKTPVGGFIYLNQNLQSKEQVKNMLVNMQKYSVERIGLPAFMCVDEEGGVVSRISGNEKFNIPKIINMSEVGKSKDIWSAYEIGVTMGQYLSELGFNVDFAPVADVLTNPDNKVVQLRSFGTDAENVSFMTMAISNGLMTNDIYSTYKHYPGHGATLGDTHEGYAYTDKTLDELMECELVPFMRGIENGISFIMVGHISTPNITGDDLPASLSEYMVNRVLRSDMGYDGIVITDAMNMGAITYHYSSKEAAVKALQAGVDIILMPQDFHEAYEGVLEAIEKESLSLERIDESVSRIIKLKLQILED